MAKRSAASTRQAHPAADHCHEIEIPFEEDLYEPFYAGRQFSVRDPNGLTLIFYDLEATP